MKKAGEVISALFKENFGNEFMEIARSNAGLFSSWSEIVAEAWQGKIKVSALEDSVKNPGLEDLPPAAAHSRICELERGLLLVEADHPGWIQILQTKRQELLAAAGRRYPELGIRSIAFKLSREPF